jgi:hypothetical protein
VRNEHNQRKSSNIDPPNAHTDTINIPPSNTESSANLPTPKSTGGEQNMRDGFHYQQQQGYIEPPTMLDSDGFELWGTFENVGAVSPKSVGCCYGPDCSNELAR